MLKALQGALQIRVPELHRSDQGLHDAAIAHVELLMSHDVQISMAAAGRAYENGHAEPLIRTIKDEEVNLFEYRNFCAARSEISYSVEDVHQSKRIHSALGYLTPIEFEAVWEMAPEGERVPRLLVLNLSSHMGPVQVLFGERCFAGVTWGMGGVGWTRPT
jgi:transposase InsO family protein